MAELKIREDFCKGCGLCIGVCRQGVLSLDDRLNAKGYNYVEAAAPEKCVACRACTVMCPEGAIELYR